MSDDHIYNNAHRLVIFVSLLCFGVTYHVFTSTGVLIMSDSWDLC